MDATEKMFKVYASIKEMTADTQNFKKSPDGFIRLISDGRIIAVTYKGKIYVQGGKKLS